mmetsp:Transcript_25601/g.80147  ORF Transcript_25601/g.80147 Transcript_25601/m.80147 type:complete len:212 (+) Transcript_25601:561-1196(+)
MTQTRSRCSRAARRARSARPTRVRHSIRARATPWPRSSGFAARAIRPTSRSRRAGPSPTGTATTPPRPSLARNSTGTFAAGRRRDPPPRIRSSLTGPAAGHRARSSASAARTSSATRRRRRSSTTSVLAATAGTCRTPSASKTSRRGRRRRGTASASRIARTTTISTTDRKRVRWCLRPGLVSFRPGLATTARSLRSLTFAETYSVLMKNK